MNSILGVSTTECECSEAVGLDAKVCSSRSIIDIMKEYSKTPSQSSTTILNKIEKQLKCDNEVCVLENPEFKKFVKKQGEIEKLNDDKVLRFKPSGPRSTLELITNFNIADVLAQWGANHDEFYPYAPVMMDFNKTGGSLCASVPDIINSKLGSTLQGNTEVYNFSPSKFKYLGGIVNTDYSYGHGKHWVAVFVDCRQPIVSVEYFNSSGNPPTNEIIEWMETTCADLEFIGREAYSDAVTDRQHQEGPTECGLYALYYIRCRLEGNSQDLFRDNKITDDEMTKFRKHLFRN